MNPKVADLGDRINVVGSNFTGTAVSQVWIVEFAGVYLGGNFLVNTLGEKRRKPSCQGIYHPHLVHMCLSRLKAGERVAPAVVTSTAIGCVDTVMRPVKAEYGVVVATSDTPPITEKRPPRSLIPREESVRCCEFSRKHLLPFGAIFLLLHLAGPAQKHSFQPPKSEIALSTPLTAASVASSTRKSWA